MLFPNTRVRMRLMDKLFIGVPALVSGGIVLSTKLGASLVLLGSLFGYWLGLHDQPTELNQARVMMLLAGAAALAGYLWKQFSSFKNRKIRFMQALTQNLYFRNLDNNAGVFHRLVNDAEDEESKGSTAGLLFFAGESDTARTGMSWIVRSKPGSRRTGTAVSISKIEDALAKTVQAGPGGEFC